MSDAKRMTNEFDDWVFGFLAIATVVIVLVAIVCSVNNEGGSKKDQLQQIGLSDQHNFCKIE